MILLLVLPSTIMLAGNGGSSSLVAHAQDDDLEEDLVEGEEDLDATVETESDEAGEGPGGDGVVVDADPEREEEEEEEEKPLKPSEDADTYLLFTKPTSMAEFPAGQMVRLLVGFTNKGDKEFIVETMDASFRYPQDYSFYIQNFTAVRYNKAVEPQRQATFEYAFTPSETFNARPFGLTINVNYKDSEGILFQDAVFNETINIVEPDEGLDGETFFLYVFLAAVAVLLLVGAQQLLASFGKKRGSRSKPRQVVEMGTQNKGDVDYDWLPKETLNDLNRSPRSKSPKQSPKQRRAKRATGSGDE